MRILIATNPTVFFYVSEELRCFYSKLLSLGSPLYGRASLGDGGDEAVPQKLKEADCTVNTRMTLSR